MCTGIIKSVLLTLWLGMACAPGASGEGMVKPFCRSGNALAFHPGQDQQGDVSSMPIDNGDAGSQKASPANRAMAPSRAPHLPHASRLPPMPGLPHAPGLDLPSGLWAASPLAQARQPCALLVSDEHPWSLGLGAGQAYLLPGFQTLALGMQWSPGRLGQGGHGQGFGLGFRRTGDRLHLRQQLQGSYARRMGPHWSMGLGLAWEWEAFERRNVQHRPRVLLGVSAHPREGWQLDAVLTDPHWPGSGRHAGIDPISEEQRIAPSLRLASLHRLGQSVQVGYGLRMDLAGNSHTSPGIPGLFVQLYKQLGPDWGCSLGVSSQPLMGWIGLVRRSSWGAWQCSMRWHPVLGWGGGLAWTLPGLLGKKASTDGAAAKTGTTP